jgi:hypothetical protein
VGGFHDGRRWLLDEDTAIREAQLRRYDFYVDMNGRYVEVIVATHNGRKYLKTVTDGYAPNNLLNLPECP